MSEMKLEKNPIFNSPDGPLVFVIMDGVGIGTHYKSDCFAQARTPNLDWLKNNTLYTEIKAHGKAVGLPDDSDMGNSEVGHNAIGCGRIFDQGAALIDQAIASGMLYDGEVWNELITNVKDNQSTLHMIGLLSDGKVHSNICHLESMLLEAKNKMIKKIRIHALIDGRDVPPLSALEYVERIENFLADINSDKYFDYRIASGGGRMKITMDRYDADWPMIEKGWNTHVLGKGRPFNTIKQAITTLRSEEKGILDQDLPSFVIHENEKAIGPIEDGDSVILFNYRGDRALEITKAFEADELTEFDRGEKPKVLYAGMMQYDGDLGIPKKFLVSPPAINKTMSEYLSNSNISQFAISETQKYGHVTYFFNGNNSSKFNTETWVEIPSDNCAFDEKPRMQADVITDEVIKAIHTNKFKFIRINYPNGDMVGHTGNIPAVIASIEAVDDCLGRIIKELKKVNGVLICSADHGNSDDMIQINKKTNSLMYDEDGNPFLKTSHSLNPVPVYIYDPSNQNKLKLSKVNNPGVSNLAATCITMLGYKAPEEYTKSLIEIC